MNKKNSVNHLGKPKDEREALIKSQVKSLLDHGYIRTTRARAKAVSQKIDTLMTYAVEKNQKSLVEYLNDRTLVEKIMKVDTKGKRSGFTTMVALKNRPGDNAEVVLVELNTK